VNQGNRTENAAYPPYPSEFEYPFSETNQIKILPPEEAAALRKRFGLE